jgi:nucleoside-diphosphate-sugar epimerase
MAQGDNTIFITGVSGFVGPRVLRDLLLKNYSVVALLHDTGRPAKEQLEEIFERAEIPAHYAGKVQVVH